MTMTDSTLPGVLRHSPIRVIFGPGTLSSLGAAARENGAHRVLLVTDPGIIAAGHVARAVSSLEAAGVGVTVFDGVAENPTCDHVYAGVAFAKAAGIDFIVGLGGGSSMDCAKGINLVLTGGGPVEKFWGEGKATKPMLPLIAVPTTAGTGSEAQSFALITDPRTKQKMACGDRRWPGEGGLRPRVAILDPDLTASQPPRVATASTIDAIAHAIETAGATNRSDTSLALSRAAWTRLDDACEAALDHSPGGAVRASMLLGAHLAGAAIEHSMLGAAHACANPLTARYGVTHGIAVGVMLPSVIRFNAETGENPYEPLGLDADTLARRVESLLDRARVDRRLRDHGVTPDAIPDLAELAARQWTAKFNPRPVRPAELATIYRSAIG
jgi:alcohol dehydrogenase